MITFQIHIPFFINVLKKKYSPTLKYEKKKLKIPRIDKKSKKTYTIIEALKFSNNIQEVYIYF